MKTKKPTYEELEKKIIQLENDFDNERKRADKIIVEFGNSFKLLNEMMNNSSSLIYMIDTEGKFIYLNDNLAKLFGKTINEVVGKTRENFLPAQIAAQNLANDKEIFETLENRYFEEENIEADGKHYYFTIKFPLIDTQNNLYGIAGISTDITKKKETERELYKALKLYEKAFQTSPIPTVLTKLPGRIIIDVNNAFEELFEYEFAKIKGRSIMDFELWENNIEREEIAQIMFNKGMILNYEFKYKTKSQKIGNGIFFTEIFDVNDERFVLTKIVDITERRQAEDALRKSKEELRQFWDTDISADYITDLEGNLLNCNPTFLKLFGFNENFQPQNINIKKLYKSLNDRQELINKVIQKGKIENYEIDFVNKNGEIIHTIINAIGISDDYGKLSRIRGYIVDISKRKIAEKELIISRDKAEESNRLKSAFLANMSHEIRTPMNGILGFAELLKNAELSGSQQQEYLDIIEKSGARMLNIINDIVNISKIESGAMNILLSHTNVNNQMEYVYKTMKLVAERKNIQFSYFNSLDDNDAIINSDQEKLVSIISNLVKNAIKYTDSGTIEFGYYLKFKKDKSEFEFYVKDTGIGISKERQEAIFERFIQADIEDKMARQGAGLGLTISKAYVLMLGGKIWLESEPNRGSTFYFTIPVNNKIEKTLTEKNLFNEEKKSNLDKLKILIVEDDYNSIKYLIEIVKHLSKNVLTAVNGLEAINLCRQNNDIDLILMDIQMPVLNGYKATEQIRQFNKDVIIIAQTAFALSGDNEKAKEAGCNDYISKPINRDNLIKIIYKHLKNK